MLWYFLLNRMSLWGRGTEAYSKRLITNKALGIKCFCPSQTRQICRVSTSVSPWPGEWRGLWSGSPRGGLRAAQALAEVLLLPPAPETLSPFNSYGKVRFQKTGFLLNAVLASRWDIPLLRSLHISPEVWIFPLFFILHITFQIQRLASLWPVGVSNDTGYHSWLDPTLSVSVS